MLNHLMTEVENFRGNQELADDLTLVAIQLQPAAGRQPLVRSAAGT
jgi:hypothetical protein